MAQNALTPYAKNRLLTVFPISPHITVAHNVRIPKPQIKPTTIVQNERLNARRLKDRTSIMLVIKCVKQTTVSCSLPISITDWLSVIIPRSCLEKITTIVPRQRLATVTYMELVITVFFALSISPAP